MKSLAPFLLLLSSFCNAGNYSPLNQDCDGFSQVAIGSYGGTCVGLVNQFDGFKKPRKAIQLDEHHLLVTDMGGWSANRGKLWLVQSTQPHLRGELTVTPLLTKLDMPHDIELDAKGRVLLAEVHQVRRLTMQKGRIVLDEVVITGLPNKGALHPLSNFVQLANGDLVINVGSKTDHCEDKVIKGLCTELSKNGLWQYAYDATQDTYARQGKHIASGLRNSMALAVHQSGSLLQAENSSDLSDAEEPYEELNIIKQGGFYGWPYCLNEHFDQGMIEGGCEQNNYQSPYLLLPPHTAPLDMVYAKTSQLPMLDGKLLMSWHGYRVVGNRLVAYDVDKQGLPILTAQAWFNRDPIAPATEWTRHAFAAKGGMIRQAQHVEIISHWNKVEGVRPEGAPVGLTMLLDETLLIVDDKNKALLRLAKGSAYQSNNVTALQSNTVKAYAAGQVVDLNLDVNQILKATLLENCSACHVEISATPDQLLNNHDGWLVMEDGETKIERALFSKTRPMPPTGSLSHDKKKTLLKLLKQAIEP
jgi:glucose/arabinose dehydrogenase